MRSVKHLIFDGLRAAAGDLPRGRAGVLVDEQYGGAVIEAAAVESALVLAMPVEESGQEWFTLQYGRDWLEHVERIGPDYAKVLIRDNPDFDPDPRRTQLADLARVSAQLGTIGVPLLYELLVPATDAQLDSVHGDVDAYDRDLRPELVARVSRTTKPTASSRRCGRSRISRPRQAPGTWQSRQRRTDWTRTWSCSVVMRPPIASITGSRSPVRYLPSSALPSDAAFGRTSCRPTSPPSRIRTPPMRSAPGSPRDTWHLPSTGDPDGE